MIVDDLGDDVGEVILRFYAAELAGFNQRSDNGPVFAAAIGSANKAFMRFSAITRSLCPCRARVVSDLPIPLL